MIHVYNCNIMTKCIGNSNKIIKKQNWIVKENNNKIETNNPFKSATLRNDISSNENSCIIRQC